jgi:Ribonuclease G/E
LSEVEVFLDDTPGEIRGIVARDGRYEQLLLERPDDVAEFRLGAVNAGRVVEVSPALKGAFVDLGVGKAGFLPLRGGKRVGQGDRIEVEVAAEPREGKGPTLRLIGPAAAGPGLLRPAPPIREILSILHPGCAPITGAAAIRAAQEAEEEALRPGALYSDTGLDLSLERTRALIAVDFDLAPRAGIGSGGQGRERANRQGLRETARLLRLKRWAGLVVIDLIGTGHDGPAVLAAARKAFGEDGAAYGPVSRFGLLQLSLPWERTPLEEVFNGPDRRRRLTHRAQDAVRALRLALLLDTRSPRLRLRCRPEEAALAAPLVAQLGPRAELQGDPALASGDFAIEEV